MDSIPIFIQNKIMFYLSHPIADILRDKAVVLRYNKCYNFTHKLEKGLIIKPPGRKHIFQILWEAKIVEHIIS